MPGSAASSANPQSVTCPQCHKELTGDFVFCPHCGNRVGKA
ncbi:MAG TPA: zinc-ribbon domain-containing protein [Desulfobaccales bacterium]